MLGDLMRAKPPTLLGGEPGPTYHQQDRRWNAEIKQILETPLSRLTSPLSLPADMVLNADGSVTWNVAGTDYRINLPSAGAFSLYFAGVFQFIVNATGMATVGQISTFTGFSGPFITSSSGDLLIRRAGVTKATASATGLDVTGIASASTQVNTPIVDTASGDLTLKRAGATKAVASATGLDVTGTATASTQVTTPIVDTASGDLTLKRAGATKAVANATGVAVTGALTTTTDVTAAAAVSGATVATAQADIKHAARTVPIAAATGQPGSTATWVPGSRHWTVPSNAATSVVVVPLPVSVGDRITGGSLYGASANAAGNDKYTFQLFKKPMTSGAETQLGTTQTAGVNGDISLPISGLTETVVAGTQYYAVFAGNGVGAGTRTLYGVEVTFDRP